MKPVRTLDLVVLAVEWGSGRRQGWLSNLHLGARGEDGEFVMVGKTFKGLTDELLTLADRALPGAQDRASPATPCTCVRSRSSRSRSTACRRRAATRAASPSASRGCAATDRDKTPADADTIETVRAAAGYCGSCCMYWFRSK